MTAPDSSLESKRLSSADLRQLTLAGCRVAKSSADAMARGIASGAGVVVEQIRNYEEELDTLDRQINEGVTAAIVHVSQSDARELLACLKLIIELERIGDLLLSVANRLESVVSRLESQDLKDLAGMATIVCGMLGDVTDAFTRRDVNAALRVLKADAELDRLRNMIFVRHVDNPEREPRREGFHLVFMAQALERSGDHAKNLAEEICHLVSGQSVRHILRENDRPLEQVYLERMRRSGKKEKLKAANPAT